jgi:hypothetical protein
MAISKPTVRRLKKKGRALDPNSLASFIEHWPDNDNGTSSAKKKPNGTSSADKKTGASSKRSGPGSSKDKKTGSSSKWHY